MLTVTQLARRSGLSRGTLLYYESIGLLKPPQRTGGNYRAYGERDVRRLEQICAYRSAGLKLSDIRGVLDRPRSDASEVLNRRLLELENEVERIREHQRLILKLLKTNRTIARCKEMTKDKWVSIMRAAGFQEDDMRRWHTEFERSAPEDHQSFLEYLHIPGEEIERIRQWSRTGHAG